MPAAFTLPLVGEGPAIHCLYDELVEPGSLTPHPKNRNTHPKEQIDRLAKILEYQGWRYAIKISKKSGFITSGHGRMAAAILKSWESVPVVYQDYESDEQEYADVQADNAIASWADLDLSAINLDVPDLGPDFDIDLLGIQNFEIEAADKYAEKDADETPDARPTSIVRGDLFLLGEHRLLCGDSTNVDDIAKVMNGELADMIFTDPPYNIAYEGGSKKRKQIENDEMDNDTFANFLLESYTRMFECTKEGAPIYVCHADTERVNFTAQFKLAGFKLSSIVVWAKNNATFGRQDYFWKHEPILYGWKEGAAHKWYGPNNEETIWNIDRPSRSEEHPTMKPIALIERALKNSSRGGDLLFEPFGGSGSTLIACEKNNRRCNTIEFDPSYCQVILDRFEKFTGIKPVKI